jgi:hypothetical protein
MPTERAPTRQPPDASAGRRLHIHGIKEMPAGYDAEVAELFRDFRAASNLSEADLAARLATRIEVVQALEQGALYALPEWAETCRVVNNYGLLLNLDVRPLLRRIYAQVEAGIVELRPKPMPDVPFMMPPEARDADFAAAPPPPPPPPRSMPQRAPAPQRQEAPPPPRPNAGARPQAPGPYADRRAQLRPLQMQPPRAPQTPPPRAAQRPQAAPAPAAPAKRARKASPLVKWGIVALLVLGLGVGVWMLLDEAGLLGPSTALTGANPGAKSLDPDDPRSRKTDRLPSPNGF